MRYLSVCSGIEAATVAWHPLGWTPVAFAEIEKFPSAVLAHHYPTVPNWGDMTKFKEWPDAAIDLLVGGTPCQSFSVAGLRKGLDDPRGNLMLTYLAIAQRYRPKWVVWENVPGVLSSNQGRDFASLLRGLVELGYGWAYRVLDAQFTRTSRFPGAVPQRRRRVFVVGHLGDWRAAAAVFLERESFGGHPPPQRKARQAVARGVASSTQANCVPETVGALTDGAHNGGGLNGQDAYTGRIFPVIMESGQAGASIQSDGSAPTLTCLHEAPLVVGALDSRHAGGFQSVQSAHQGHLITQPVAHALRGEGFDASEDGTGRGTPLVPVAQSLTFSTPAIGDIRQDDVASTMSANTGGGGETQNPAFITQPVAFYDYLGSQGGGVEVGISPPLKKKDGVAISLDQPSPLAFKIRGGCEREDGSRGSTNIGKAAGKGYLGSEHTAFTVASSQDQWVAQPVLSNDPAHAICANEQRTYTNEGSVFQLRNVVGQPVAMRESGQGFWMQDEIAGTLRAEGEDRPSRPSHVIAQPVAFTRCDNGQDAAVDVTPTMRCGSNYSAHLAVAQQVDVKQVQWASGGGQVENDTAQALRSGAEHNYQFARVAMQVRRLTPLECARLQGFPDDYLLQVPWRGKTPPPDGPMYKALGNSMAVNCMDWIGQRIQMVEEVLKTVKSRPEFTADRTTD